MEHKPIDLKMLSMDELAGVVNLYPWFGAARKELCRRMAGMGGASWGVEQFADQALYVGNRAAVADIMCSGDRKDYEDRNLENLVRSYIAEDDRRAVTSDRKIAAAPSARQVPGGDFFSRNEYESVRKDEDNVFSRFHADKVRTAEDAGAGAEIDFCTETLAEIYAEQGYFDQAKRIYSKLILAFPEKSAYFASLIKKMDYLINIQTL